jgi:hypothetical protein
MFSYVCHYIYCIHTFVGSDLLEAPYLLYCQERGGDCCQERARGTVMRGRGTVRKDGKTTARKEGETVSGEGTDENEGKGTVRALLGSRSKGKEIHCQKAGQYVIREQDCCIISVKTDRSLQQKLRAYCPARNRGSDKPLK